MVLLRMAFLVSIVVPLALGVMPQLVIICFIMVRRFCVMCWFRVLWFMVLWFMVFWFVMHFFLYFCVIVVVLVNYMRMVVVVKIYNILRTVCQLA
jgi:hypothetical protein